jgi:hypothetical protein
MSPQDRRYRRRGRVSHAVRHDSSGWHTLCGLRGDSRLATLAARTGRYCQVCYAVSRFYSHVGGWQ